MHRGKKNYSKRLHRCLVWATAPKAPKAFTGVSVSIHNRAVFRRSLNHAYSSKVLSEVQWAHMPGWECPNSTAEIPGIFFCPWFSLGTLPHSHPQSFPSSFTARGTYLPWAPEQTDVSHVQEKKKKTSKPAEFLKIKFPMLCCGPWCPPLPSQPRHDPMLQILPSGCSTPQLLPSWAAQTKLGRPKREETQPGGRIRWLGPFSVRLEFIQKMNTSLGEKLVYPSWNFRSGWSISKWASRSAILLPMPFLILCYWFCLGIAEFFVHWILKALFSLSSLMMLPAVELWHQLHYNFPRTSGGQGDLHLTQKLTFISLTTCYKNNKIWLLLLIFSAWLLNDEGY